MALFGHQGRAVDQTLVHQVGCHCPTGRPGYRVFVDAGGRGEVAGDRTRLRTMVDKSEDLHAEEVALLRHFAEALEVRMHLFRHSHKAAAMRSRG